MDAASGTGANHCHSDWRADRSIGKKERQRDERWVGKMERQKACKGELWPGLCLRPCYTHPGLCIRWDSCTYFLKQTQPFSLIMLSWVSVDRNETIPLNFFIKQTTNSKREMEGNL